MAHVLLKEVLAPDIYRYRLAAPQIAKKRRAGQFIILRATERSERIPLTIADASVEEGWIEVIFQAVGASTLELAALRQGQELSALAGPLGRPTHIEKFGSCLCIGGGVGIAPLYPIVCALKAAGNQVTTIIGARNKDLLILEGEMRKASDELYVATDDGSYGRHGLVTYVFGDLVNGGRKFDFAIVIGPAPMMRATSNLVIAQGIKTYASLNPIMIDGTGMCGGCRVTVFGETKFACVDGPEFDAAGIDWDVLVKRLASYREFEKRAKEKHVCNLGKAG